MTQNFRRLRRRFQTVYSILDSKNGVFEAPRRRRDFLRVLNSYNRLKHNCHPVYMLLHTFITRIAIWYGSHSILIFYFIFIFTIGNRNIIYETLCYRYLFFFFLCTTSKTRTPKKQKHTSYDGVSISLKARDGLHFIYLWKKIYNEP